VYSTCSPCWSFKAVSIKRPPKSIAKICNKNDLL
jgi:hypothetical protein